MLGSEEGYNKAAAEYKKFHKELASYDKGLFQRFLPRELKGKNVLDIGAGDGRVYKYFADKGVRYVAMDIAEKLLKRGPSRVEKIVADIEKDWPFPDGAFDIALCFFVLLHVQDLTHFFREAYRALKPGGRLIVLHNYQRRSYEYTVQGETFKIKDRSHSHEDIVETAQDEFFSEEHTLLVEKETPIGMLYCFTK